MTIVELSGNDLDEFIIAIGKDAERIYMLRFCIYPQGIQYKINESVWSYPIGEVKE